jgi:uncharacterized membrane protein
MTMMYSNDHMTTGGWIFAVVGMIVVVALIIGAIAWIVSKSTGGRANGAARSVDAGDILDLRLARGEITVEQHGQMHKALDPASAPTPDSPPIPPGTAGLSR